MPRAKRFRLPLKFSTLTRSVHNVPHVAGELLPFKKSDRMNGGASGFPSQSPILHHDLTNYGGVRAAPACMRLRSGAHFYVVQVTRSVSFPTIPTTGPRSLSQLGRKRRTGWRS